MTLLRFRPIRTGDSLSGRLLSKVLHLQEELYAEPEAALPGLVQLIVREIRVSGKETLTEACSAIDETDRQCWGLVRVRGGLVCTGLHSVYLYTTGDTII